MSSEIVNAFTRLRRDHPHRPLIYVPASRAALSAANIAEGAERVGEALDAAALEPERVILSAVGNAPLAFAVLLACRARGLALLPVDRGTTDAEVAALAEQFDAVAVISADGSLAIPAHPTRATSYRGVAMLKLTSGSRGRARHVHTRVGAGQRRAHRGCRNGIRPDDVQIAAIPLSHSYGIGNLVMPLLLQGTAICLRDAFVPQRIPDDARQFNARHLPGAPYMFDHLATHPPPGGWPPSLTRLVSAGAPLEPDVAERFRAAFGVKIHSFYGTSETGGIAFDDDAGPAATGFVGRALPGVRSHCVTKTTGREPGSCPQRRRQQRLRRPRRCGRVFRWRLSNNRPRGVRREHMVWFFAAVCRHSSTLRAGKCSRRKSSARCGISRVWLTLVCSASKIGTAARNSSPAWFSRAIPRRWSSSAVLRRAAGRPQDPTCVCFLDRIPLTARGKTDRERLQTFAAERIAGDGML